MQINLVKLGKGALMEVETDVQAVAEGDAMKADKKRKKNKKEQ